MTGSSSEDATVTAASARSRRVATGASPAAQSIGRFIISGELGRGGMGAVYAAVDPELERRVAIKVISRPETEVDDYRERFIDEARTMAQLSHPNVVQVYDVGVREGRPWIAMELIEGITLARWLKEHPTARPDQVIDVFRRAGRGLAAAHEAGIVHRDFKPANVLVAPGRVVVVDFGIAARIEREPDEGRGLDLSGTPAYMSLEQLEGKPADPRTDQFSFCVALYEALANVPPFPRTPVGARLDAIEAGEIAAPERAIATRVRSALERGLSSDPQARWPSMNELLQQLERPSRAWVAWPIAAAVGAAGWLSAQQTQADPCAELPQRVDAVWNAEVRAILAETLEATGAPEADETLALLTADLDEYTNAWAEAATESCTATHHMRTREVAEHERTMACLTSSLHQLEASLAVAQTTSTTRQEPFRALLDPIPRPSQCESGTNLPTTWDLFDEDTATIERAKASLDFGDAERALEMLEPYLEGGRDYEALEVARATIAAAHAHESLGNIDTALSLARQSATATVRLDDDEGFARAAALLCRITGRAGKHDEAITWGELGLAMLEGTALDDARGDLLNELALTNQLRYQPDLAEPLLQSFLELSVDRHGADSTRLIAPLGNLASNALLQGEYERSKDYLDRGMEIADRELDPHSKRTLTLRSSMAAVLHAAGDYPAAWEQAKAVVADIDEHLPANDLTLAGPLSILADISAERGDYDGARQMLERTQQVFRQQRSTLQALMIDSQRANLLRLNGKYDEARALLEDTQAKTAALVGDDNYIIGEFLLYRSENELDAGNLEAAQRLVDEARPYLEERTVGFDAQQCLADIFEGRIALARDDKALAVSKLRKAVRCADDKGQNVSLPPLARLHLAKALLARSPGLDTIEPIDASPRELLEQAAELSAKMGETTMTREIATALVASDTSP